jgi:hypothetical protein
MPLEAQAGGVEENTGFPATFPEQLPWAKGTLAGI